MSARNRELFALIPVALLLTAGFAAVFSPRRTQLGNLSLIYGAYFLALCLATHIYPADRGSPTPTPTSSRWSRC